MVERITHLPTLESNRIVVIGTYPPTIVWLNHSNRPSDDIREEYQRQYPNNKINISDITPVVSYDKSVIKIRYGRGKGGVLTLTYDAGNPNTDRVGIKVFSELFTRTYHEPIMRTGARIEFDEYLRENNPALLALFLDIQTENRIVLERPKHKRYAFDIRNEREYRFLIHYHKGSLQGSWSGPGYYYFGEGKQLYKL